MASPPGLFYAYAKETFNDSLSRHLIVFTDRATADEWWRAVEDSVAAGHERFSGVKRLSYQWYNHDPERPGYHRAIGNTITDDRVAKQFLGRVFFTLLSDRDHRGLSVAPVLNYTDHISGRGYFIRSVVHPDRYWSVDTNDQQMFAFTRGPSTKFIISINSSKNSDGRVMIGSDPITIRVAGTRRYVSIRSDGNLTTSLVPSTAVLKFSDLDGNFMVGQRNELVYDTEAGERWELVF